MSDTNPSENRAAGDTADNLDYDPALENIRSGVSVRQLVQDAPCIVFSVALHAVLLLALAVCYMPVIVDFRPDLTANIEDIEDIENIDIFEEEPVEMNLDENADIAPMATSIETAVTEIEVTETPKLEAATADLGNIMAPDSLISNVGALNGDALGGRKGKGAAVAQGGGSEASEKSVAMGLAWIAAHQLPNGAWSYTQLRNPDCRGKCKDTPLDSANKSSVSATAMALLPMLGAGMTHKDGKYSKTVKGGLDYITANLQLKPEGIVLAEEDSTPIMYHHGLTAIVICEAAAMTRDKNLAKIAEGAVKYICWAQDPVGGGWRYSPKQQGDTSGMGWNFMALKSAQMAYISVPIRTVKGCKHFLDNVVGAEGGAKYGYMNGNASDDHGIKRDIRATTSIGLLGQMYMGWKPDNPALVKGTNYISGWGPDTGNLYYGYYATQVMHHIGGEKWDKWNKKIRDDLVKRQVLDGHEKGSFPVEEGHNLKSGGRLTCTALATMILEVYYRHLPLYRKTTTIDAFPLE
ncbi:MAG: hypothetical protein LBN39_11470 [Planctomycetaceae bacterium]|jgi:hypothetical protein|nr:hypothetical protein [Planctomycetaceae bacterium]